MVSGTQNETVRRALEAIRLGNRKSPDRHREQAASEPVTPAHDPAAWQEDFHWWALEKCIYRLDRDDADGIGCLHRDLCDWAIAHKSVPCPRQSFESLLADAGFERRGELVLGLVLREDFESLQAFPCEHADDLSPSSETKLDAKKQLSEESPAERAMTAAAELIATVEAAGGRFTVDDDRLSITPRAAALPVADQLRLHKAEIMQLLQDSSPPMPRGVWLVRYQLLSPPIRLSECSVVTDVKKFVRTTLSQLDAHLRGQTWQSGNWSRQELLERLRRCGCVVEIEEIKTFHIKESNNVTTHIQSTRR